MKIAKLIFPLMLLFTKYAAAQIAGCTDPLATNFNAAATVNDGTCTYNLLSISPDTSILLPANLIETSGLVVWDNKFWTHNDSQDTSLYAFEAANINNLQTYPLPNVINVDWEEIAQDSNYFYVGDFGNNVNGNRTDLNILRIAKNALYSASPIIDTLHFSYSNQTSFSPTGGNNTDFDCEAFIVSADSIYLFTKQWVSNQTSVYSFPKTVGTHIANYRATLNVQGLITGAVYNESKRLVVLCGYSSLLQPFVYLLYDFSDFHFFNGNKRKINLSLSFHQIEAITTENGLLYSLTNEKFVQSVINTPAKLHTLDLSAYLSPYLNGTTANVTPNFSKELLIYPVPFENILHIEVADKLLGKAYSLLDSQGKIVLKGWLIQPKITLNVENLPQGEYFLQVESEPQITTRLIKR